VIADRRDVNPRYRIYAAAGLGGLILLVGGFLVLGRGQAASSATVHEIKPLHPVKKAARRAAHATAKKTARKAARKAKAKTALAPPALAKTQPTDGMPAALSAALAKSSVVVVSLVAPGAPVDQMAYEEAKAGARQAGVAFVRISVANDDDVQALSTLVDSSTEAGDRLLDAPAVLVFRKPQELYVRINGYIDADTVAQAAENAAPAVQVQSGKSALADSWVTRANAVCEQFRTEVLSAGSPTSLEQVLPFVQKLVDTIKTAVAKLRALKPPKGEKPRVAGMLAQYDKMVVGLNAMLAAARHGDRSKVQQLEQQVRTAGARGDAIAAQLGATACSGVNS
jgi:hypothetical protein